MITARKKLVIIVAGGIGLRFGSNIPKQFLKISGRSILGLCLEHFYTISPDSRFLLVLPEEHYAEWEQIAKTENLAEHEICYGGKERFYSVQNGLKLAKGEDLIAIHDSVRPFASRKTIDTAFISAQQNGNGIPAIPIVDSLRYSDSESNYPLDREKIVAVQTPQIFQSEILLKAYQQDFSSSFTDDASVVENSGDKIFLTPGNSENIKITKPQDLKVAEAILPEFRESLL